MVEAEKSKLAMLIGIEFAEMQKGNFDVDYIENYVEEIVTKVRQKERERARKIIEELKKYFEPVNTEELKALSMINKDSAQIRRQVYLEGLKSKNTYILMVLEEALKKLNETI